ncbi:MAG: hypothetical protein UZ12_BCD005001478 [Bacteroidetes bacterium OLB12]|nr:MAG: hypothetical protein UZ12_BCD005001478 [Bacteroidetes bacterium OLB12]
MRFVYFLLFLTAALQGFSQSESVSMSISRNDAKTTYRTSDPFNSFNIETRGTIEVSDDDRDISSMSHDGYFEVTKTSFGSKRTIKIIREGSVLIKRYYEGRTEVNFDPAGRKWLAEILPEVVRTTTIAAESRVNRFYAKGGTPAVLAEIEAIRSDHVKSYYARLLMKKPVAEKDYSLVVTKVTGNMSSDHYITEFLENNLDKFLKNKEATEAVFAATNEMGSDHYKTQIIKEALRAQPPSVESVKIALASAAEINSDHYKTEVLTSLMRQGNLTDDIVAEMINTSKTIQSDHYRSVVLTKALERDLSPSAHQRAVESVKDIHSDHYKTQVIKSLLNKSIDEKVLAELLPVTSTIGSDHYRSEVLTMLLDRQDFSDATFEQLVEYSAEIESDHYKSEILRNALDRSDLNDTKIIALLTAAKTINSDHYLTEVLVSATSRVRTGNEALKNAYRDAARKIDSETYYGRAMRALDR